MICCSVKLWFLILYTLIYGYMKFGSNSFLDPVKHLTADYYDFTTQYVMVRFIFRFNCDAFLFLKCIDSFLILVSLL